MTTAVFTILFVVGTMFEVITSEADMNVIYN